MNVSASLIFFISFLNLLIKSEIPFYNPNIKQMLNKNVKETNISFWFCLQKNRAKRQGARKEAIKGNNVW